MGVPIEGGRLTSTRVKAFTKPQNHDLSSRRTRLRFFLSLSSVSLRCLSVSCDREGGGKEGKGREGKGGRGGKGERGVRGKWEEKEEREGKREGGRVVKVSCFCCTVYIQTPLPTESDYTTFTN